MANLMLPFFFVYKLTILLQVFALKKYKNFGGVMNKNVAIIYGGESTEHDVSVITAMQIFKRYKTDKYNLFLLYITRDGKWLIGKQLENFKIYKNKTFNKCTQVTMKIGDSNLYKVCRCGKLKKLLYLDFVINCCHGGSGENGDITSFFRMSKIPISTGVSSAMAVCMDKYLTKCFLQANKIPYIKYFAIEELDWLQQRSSYLQKAQLFGYPLVVKPSEQGSSVGVVLATDEKSFIKAVDLGFNFGERVIVEQAIINKREFNCCLIRTREGIVASKIEEPKSEKIVIDFSAKYLSGGASKKGGTKLSAVSLAGMQSSEREFPAKISKELENKIVKYSKQLYKSLNLCGVVRIDYIYDTDTKKLYLGEANTIPGSLGYYFFDTESYLENIISGSEKFWQEIYDKISQTPNAKIF